MNIKKLLIIAAVAVMLVGATSAYGYWESWSGWFNSGYLTFLSDTFYYTNGQGILQDHTYGSVDSFVVDLVTPGTFTCESGQHEGYYIKLWPDASGWKYTGQSGHKEAHNGEWTGLAILYIPNPPNPPQTIEFTAWGTWDTGTYNDGMYFNYYPETPTYSAHWDVTGSNPDGLDGEGGSAGARFFFDD